MRIIALLLALFVAGSVFWNPSTFLGNEGKLPTWQGILLIWSVCSAFIYGIGFFPQKKRWQYFFYPPLAIGIIVIFLVYFYSK